MIFNDTAAEETHSPTSSLATVPASLVLWPMKRRMRALMNGDVILRGNNMRLMVDLTMIMMTILCTVLFFAGLSIDIVA
jgi:hypothetical protein